MNFKIENEYNIEMYQLYRLFKQLLKYVHVDTLLKQFDREYIVGVGIRYNIDLSHYLKFGIIKNQYDKLKIEFIVFDINIKCEFPHINVPDSELLLLYEINTAIDDTLKRKKFKTPWSASWNILFQENAQFIITMYERLFGSDAPVFDVDEKCLIELQIALEPNPVLDLMSSYKFLWRNRGSDSKIQPGDYYYVNELTKIRFDSDFYVCNILRNKVNKYIQKNSKTYPFFEDEINILKSEYKKWLKKFHPIDIPDIVQLFPDNDVEMKINVGIIESKEYKLEKLKYYLVYMVATNILSPDKWDEMRRRQQFRATNYDKYDKYIILNQLYQQAKGIPKKEVNEYLYSLDFKDKSKDYAILADDFEHLYKCQYYLNYMINGISEFMYKYSQSDHLGKYFTTKYLRIYYLRYFEYEIGVSIVLKNLKKLRQQQHDSNTQVIRNMAWKIFSEIDHQEIEPEPERIKTLVYHTYDHPSDTLTNAIIALIMNWLDIKDVTVTLECNICNRSAIGRCCNDAAYCSVECQSVDWKTHKINHE